MAKISILEALRRGLTASKDYSDEVKDNLFVKSDTEPTNRMNQAYVKTNGITYNLAEISDLEGMVKTVNHVAPDEDGNVNVQGGGSSDIIMINEEPTEDTKIVIETSDDEVHLATMEDLEGLGGSHTYSTEEKVVGKWIDGKDIYEKTFVLTSGMTSTYNNIDLISTGISQYIYHDVTFHLTDGRNSSNYLPPTDASYGTFCSIFVDNGKMSTEIYKGSNKYINKAEITVQYIKD